MANDLQMLGSSIQMNDTSYVSNGLSLFELSPVNVLAFRKPVVIYRSRRDTGKSPKGTDQTTSEDELEAWDDDPKWQSLPPEDMAKDLRFNDKTDEDLKNLNSLLGAAQRIDPGLIFKPAWSLFLDFRSLAILGNAKGAVLRSSPVYSLLEMLDLLDNPSGAMIDCFLDMVERFKTGGGQTCDNHPTLKNKIAAHRTTIEFVNQCIELFFKKLRTPEINGDLNLMKFDPEDRSNYDPAEDRELSKDDYIKKHSFYAIGQKFLNHPVFDDKMDHVDGLVITVHDIWGLKVQIEDFHISWIGDERARGRFSCGGTLHITIYDNFGLDDDDIKLNKLAGKLEPFWAWYILQHHKKFNGEYKPFINKIDLSYHIGQFIPDNG